MRSSIHFAVALVAVVHSLQDVFPWTCLTRRDKEKRHDVARKGGVAPQGIECVNQHVQSLVVEFVSATGRNQKRVVADMPVAHRGGDASKLPAGTRAPRVEIRGRGNERIVNAVRSHDVWRLLEKLHTLAGGYVAHFVKQSA